MRHVAELHKCIHDTYVKEKEEFEKHEEKLRKKQNTSSLMFLDVERSAKSGFAYFDDSSRDRKAKSAANQRITTTPSKPVRKPKGKGVRP